MFGGNEIEVVQQTAAFLTFLSAERRYFRCVRGGRDSGSEWRCQRGAQSQEEQVVFHGVEVLLEHFAPSLGPRRECLVDNAWAPQSILQDLKLNRANV